MTGAVGQQFNLRWNNHTNNFLQVFLEQFTCQSMVDVTISCQGQFLKAHKMVLSACSPYFQELFQVHTAHNPVIIMNQMKFNDVKMIIEFMYRGEIKVLEQDIDSLLEVAESLQVKGLCTVRTKYEKGEIQSTNAESTGEEKSQVEETTPSEEQSTTMSSRRKKRKMSHTVNELANEPIISETTNGIEDKTNDDLPTEIKVEPPDIRDIDEDMVSDNMDYESRLVIDEPEETRQGPTARILKRKPSRLIKPDAPPPGSTTKWVNIAPKDPSKVVDPTKYAKIPRPPNAFMIFANEWRRTLASENPRETNKDISVRLGIMWKNLSTELKANYYQQAREADAEHKRKYPGYYYSPKEARLRKTQKDLQMNKRSTKNIDAMRLVKVYMPESHNDPPLVLSVSQSENEDNIEIDEEISAVDIEADVDLDEEPELDSMPSENGDNKTGG